MHKAHKTSNRRTMMQTRIAMLAIAASALLWASTASANGGTEAVSGPCTLKVEKPLTAYRLPDNASDEFGVIAAGEQLEALARTSDGWVGFDPGVAQAGNIGLARHRWVLLGADKAPGCLTAVELVTLADVNADLDAARR